MAVFGFLKISSSFWASNFCTWIKLEMALSLWFTLWLIVFLYLDQGRHGLVIVAVSPVKNFAISSRPNFHTTGSVGATVGRVNDKYFNRGTSRYWACSSSYLFDWNALVFISAGKITQPKASWISWKLKENAKSTCNRSLHPQQGSHFFFGAPWPVVLYFFEPWPVAF